MKTRERCVGRKEGRCRQVGRQVGKGKRKVGR